MKEKAFKKNGIRDISLGLMIMVAILFIVLSVSCHQESQDPSSSASSSVPSNASSNASSSASSITSSNASSNASSKQDSQSVSTPTYAPVSAGSLSNERLGWSYIPGGKEGAIATNTGSRIKMCERFNGIWQGDTTVKKVYLTFTIGYEYNNNTTKILDIAKSKNVKLNFFVVCNILTYENLKTMFLRMSDEGHLIGNHSWNHPMYDEMLIKSGKDVVANDLKKGEDAFFSLTGKKMPKYMRFPSGVYSEASLALMDELGYTTVFWTFAYRDWLVDKQPEPEESLAKMVNGLHNGAILYLHTVSNTNVEILSELIDEIQVRGYQIGLVNDIEK